MASRPAHLRVALAQTCPVNAPVTDTAPRHAPFETLEQNLIHVRDQVIKSAASEHADVVVFPEYFLQGLVNAGRQYLTFPSRHLTAFLSRLAQAHNISIVGTIIRPAYDAIEALDTPKDSPFAHIPLTKHPAPCAAAPSLAEWEAFVRDNPVKNHEPALENTALFIEGGSGQLLGEFVKRNLWHPEREYLAPGSDEHHVFETKWGKCGFLICWDVSHPSAGQVLSDQGVDIVIAPTYWIGYDSAPLSSRPVFYRRIAVKAIIHKHHRHPPSYESELLASLTYARCFETETVWILCNAGGPADEGYIGGSGVWMPLRGKVGGCSGMTAELSVVDVDLTVLKDARECYMIREDWSKKNVT
ncbi:MAG: hypothetical protein TREMPRED_005947 [Tremellales sp. Tagirdzhanova-0007]|nr:MAG: hypothetical protein TREMPRED_005947 [Tremellales sp. Tagirdzhanova-0007]